MNRRTGRRPAAAPQAAAPSALPDGWFDVYRRLRGQTPSTDVAEQLTAEVCRRLRAGPPPSLARQTTEVHRHFFVVQVLLERRGVLSSGA